MGLPSFFVALVYISGYLFLLFAAVCLACGFYYLAELAEEFTSLTKKVLRVMILAELGIFFLLFAYERFPFACCAVGFVSHGIYYQLLKTFPFIEPKSPQFIASIVAFVVNNVIWYRQFAVHFELFYDYRLSPTPSIASFFLICVWMVPVGFFVSLTVNDSVLPGAGIDRPSSRAGDLESKQRKTRNVVTASAQQVGRFVRRLLGQSDREHRGAFGNL